MHLASRRRQGLPLPATLPQELQVSSISAENRAAGVNWEISPDEFEAYWYIFEGIEHQNAGMVRPEEAWNVFPRSGLPQGELNRIWQLCDVDGDGCLNFG